ncbi:flagellin [Larsenimonas suaedae]|uniref:flagellin N-terminal helical domain-containing protein n=1 Tax=Larsenimonas suaedae TaxID=1851019 RepID=UPI00203C7CEF|nr:flagellin [Larsenimonas suaedae]MCM2971598.1 flagellin FliC [Larsenimonas suaedae]MCM2971600.1 flagellin FliC [Larsenimonas suaedae]
MAMVINTNTLSLQTQQNLNKSQSQLNSAIEKLSSGLRINSAKDDAAGQAIANRMSSQITGLNQASRNANDGISLAQTAEGSLDQVNDNLQRIRELTVQAQNGTNSASDVDSIQKEVNQRLEEINRVTEQTTFNGTALFSQTAATSFSIQVGANDDEEIDISIGAATGFNVFSATGGNDVTSVNGVTRGVTAQGFDVLSSTALADLDAQLKDVDNNRSDLGAVQNRFESAIDNISTTSTNLSSARSRIEDADYATEVSNMSKAQILQQAGTSVLAQANQTTQGVLSLLR